VKNKRRKPPHGLERGCRQNPLQESFGSSPSHKKKGKLQKRLRKPINEEDFSNNQNFILKSGKENSSSGEKKIRFLFPSSA